MPIAITDDLGQSLTLERLPRRIVSLVPSLTETMVLLGAQERLAGITKFCIHPKETLEDLPRVGGTKNPSTEKILALEPDLVLANAEENEKDIVEQIKKHVQVFVTFPRAVEGAIKTVRDLGILTGLEAKAQSFAEDCYNMLQSLRPGFAGKTLRTACLIWRNPWMAAGADTYMSDLLEVFGFKNIFSQGEGRYPETSIEELISREPDVAILPDEPYRFDEEHKRDIEAAFAAASLSPQILLADGTALAWFGWRTRAALTYVQELRIKKA